MANIKSAKKRIETINRKRRENRLIKSTLSTSIKKYKKALVGGDIKEAEAKLLETISLIDSACSKGVLHKNNASRKVSRLSAALDKLKKQAAKVENETPVSVVEPTKEETPVVEEVKPVKKPAAKAKTTTKTATTKTATTKTATAKTAVAKTETKEEKVEEKVEKKPAAKKTTTTKTATKK